jgi:DnaJ-class molecular chaperone
MKKEKTYDLNFILSEVLHEFAGLPYEKVEATCKKCNGTGWNTSPCKKCDGKGKIISNGIEVICSLCKGAKKYFHKPMKTRNGTECKVCRGTGIYRDIHFLT